MRQIRQQREAGFTLIELLIVILMVGILAAAGIPLYMGYVKDAKTAEAKAVVGSYWTAWRSVAQQNCGVAQLITTTYPKAGLTSAGATTPARWTVSAGGLETLISACATGALTQSANVLITGTAADVSTIRILQAYSGAATPPMTLTCSTDSAATYTPC